MSTSTVDPPVPPSDRIVYVPDRLQRDLAAAVSEHSGDPQATPGRAEGERIDVPGEGEPVGLVLVAHSLGGRVVADFLLTSRRVPVVVLRSPDRGRSSGFSAEEAERHYRAMRSWKQPEPARGEARAFWTSSDEEGARWLARRLRDESQVEAFHAAVSALTAMGEVAIGPAVEALSDDPAPDQALTLLRALGWIGESGTHPTLGGAQAELVLADFLQHDDPDIREAAAHAMRLLRPDRAERWLSHRLRDEKDPEVVEAIEGELSRHSTRRA